MLLSLKQLQYLRSVAEVGSIQGAAARHGISPSSILAALTIAEAEIAAPIFIRRPSRGVIVTPAGERYIAAARALLAAQDEFERSTDMLATRPPRQIRIGCFEPFGALFMTAVLRRYCAIVGEVAVTLREGDQSQLRQELEAGSIDVAVAYDIGSAFASSTPIVSVPTHALLHRADPLARQASVQVSQLAERPLVLLDLPVTADFLVATFNVLASRPSIALRTRSYETVRSAVADGFGCSVLNMRPTTTTSADADMLVRRPLAHRLPAPWLIVADIYGAQKPRFVQTFIQTMRDHFNDIGRAAYAVEA
ncbi:MAG: LysR family transcriptional regulator [Labrys sp. (in: a-proteobacteria)]